jgi:hypothetical protein
LQQFRDRWIAVSPVGFQFHNRVTLKRLSHLGTLENIGLVKFASNAPRSRKIDKNGMALVQFRLQPLGCERLPVAAKSRTG